MCPRIHVSMLECGGRSALARREKSRRVAGAGWDLMSVLFVILLPTFSELGQYSCSNGAFGIVFRSFKPIRCPKLDRNRRQGQPYLSNKKRISTSGSVRSSEWFSLGLCTFAGQLTYFCKKVRKGGPSPPRAMGFYWIFIENHEKSKKSIRFQ